MFTLSHVTIRHNSVFLSKLYNWDIGGIVFFLIIIIHGLLKCPQNLYRLMHLRKLYNFPFLLSLSTDMCQVQPTFSLLKTDIQNFRLNRSFPCLLWGPILGLDVCHSITLPSLMRGDPHFILSSISSRIYIRDIWQLNDTYLSSRIFYLVAFYF